MEKDVKTLCIGDVHFMVENIPEVNLFIERIEKLCFDKELDFIVILGDVLHTHERLHVIPLNKAYEFIDKMRKIAKTYVIVGNHDMECNTTFLVDHHWMNGMKDWDNVVIVDNVKIDIINGVQFTFVPYVYPSRFCEALNTVGDEWLKSKCIFAHQEFRGAKMGAVVSVEGDNWSLDYPDVISGHIHSKQRIQENIYYTGSAMQHAFGESEENTVAYVSFNVYKKGYVCEEIDLKLPRKKIVYKDIEDMETYKVPECEDKLKVSISGSYDQFKSFKKSSKYKNIVEKGIKVVFKPKKLDIKNSDIELKNNISTSDGCFDNILFSIISKEKNKYLSQLYEMIINKKNVSEEDIMFVN